MSDIPSVWAVLVCADPRAMITFVSEGFGFTERVVYADEQTVHHAELTWTGPSGQVGGVMLGPVDGAAEPGSTVVHVVTDDPDGRFAAAVAAGATVVREPHDVDYGSRMCILRDPEGNLWSFGTWYE